MSADTSREEQASSRGAEGQTKDNITCRAHGKTMCRDCLVVDSKHTCQAMWGTDVVLLYALVGHYWLCPHAPPNWTLGPMARDVQELWPFIMQ